jgi:uncharacterized protein (DUF58 family)
MIRRRTKPLITLSTLVMAALAAATLAAADILGHNMLYWAAGSLIIWILASMVLHASGLAITFGGIVFTGITAFVMMAAQTSQAFLLFWALGLMIGALVISGVLACLMLRNIDVRRVIEGSAVAGLTANVHYVLTNRRKRWPVLAVQIREANVSGPLLTSPDGYCMQASSNSTQTMMTHMVAARRGVLKLADIVVSSAFPFGFLLHTIHIDAPREVIVYPRIGLLNSRLAMQYRESITGGSMTSSLRGGGDEFYGLREYRPGDNVRTISWKRTAHTGQIVVREMTSNAPPQMMVVLDIRRWRELPEGIGAEQVERAIELAASLLCYGSMENFAIGLTIAGLPEEKSLLTHSGREARVRMLSALAMLDPNEVRGNAPPPTKSRIARRPQWILVTLRRGDPIDDLTPAGASRTIMAMDDPEAETWLRFVGSLDAIRMSTGEMPPGEKPLENAPAAAST